MDYVDGTDAEAVEAALPGAKLLYLESPCSMVFELQDIARLTKAARALGIVTMIDNSWATPVFQKPISHGYCLRGGPGAFGSIQQFLNNMGGKAGYFRTAPRPSTRKAR